MTSNPSPIETEPWALSEEMQIFGQEHADEKVRKLWLAWFRSQARLREQAEVLRAINTTLQRELKRDREGFTHE